MKSKQYQKVGVIGGGQLAQMLASAGEPLGISLLALNPELTCPASYTAQVMSGSETNPPELAAFAEKIDVLTFEFENIDLTALKKLDLPIYPSLKALQIAQDRELEKNYFQQQGVPTTYFQIMHSTQMSQSVFSEIGFPAVVKTCRNGYDGKGQAVIRDWAEWEQKKAIFEGYRVIVENWIPYERELSLISVRDRAGEIRYYPLTENQHQHGILRLSLAPYLQADLQAQAETYVKRLLESLDYVGVLTVEFFEVGGQLIANEMAPRVHNSGHWTIEGAVTSQFENHLRAVCGLPLGETTPIGYSAMLNLIGELPAISEILALPKVHFHNYHKNARPHRKMGHATLCTLTPEERHVLLPDLMKLTTL